MVYLREHIEFPLKSAHIFHILSCLSNAFSVICMKMFIWDDLTIENAFILYLKVELQNTVLEEVPAYTSTNDMLVNFKHKSSVNCIK